ADELKKPSPWIPMAATVWGDMPASPPAPAVAVKPLGWGGVRGSYVPETYEAETPVGFYQVFADEDSAAGAVIAEFAQAREAFGTTEATSVSRTHSFDAAKAAAQA